MTADNFTEAARAEAERWASVIGYEGYYEVSTEGRVRRTRPASGTQAGRIRTGHRDRDGYLYIGLSRDGESRKRLVHVLVLEAFVCPRPEGMEACHNDGDAGNPRLDNLRWDTPSNNNRDKVLHGTDHSWWAGRTHCANGHELSAENVSRRSTERDARRCLLCRREQRRGTCAECGKEVADLRGHVRRNHERKAS